MSKMNTNKDKGIAKPLMTILRLYIVIAVPVLLVIGSVRLVMNTQFLNFEYNRAGFPEDRYGFSTEDRMEYGQYGISYLLNDSDIAYLADRTLTGDVCYPPQDTACSMFSDRELGHMEDVKVVANGAFSLACTRCYWQSSVACYNGNVSALRHYVCR
ncbi:MAG: DUF1461 domain-containing protein [Anaerolineae bacterium]|nr:DUF1461 domain-containing protein [Anaerolineae bacterium]